MQRNAIGARPDDRQGLSEWYAAALEDQASSGLSVADYAIEIGVTAATLYQWRRRLSEEGGTRPVRRGGGLVEVMVKPGTPAAESCTYVVRVGCGGRSIEVRRGFDSGELQRLVTLLESC